MHSFTGPWLLLGEYVTEKETYNMALSRIQLTLYGIAIYTFFLNIIFPQRADHIIANLFNSTLQTAYDVLIKCIKGYNSVLNNIDITFCLDEDVSLLTAESVSIISVDSENVSETSSQDKMRQHGDFHVGNIFFDNIDCTLMKYHKFISQLPTMFEEALSEPRLKKSQFNFERYMVRIFAFY